MSSNETKFTPITSITNQIIKIDYIYILFV